MQSWWENIKFQFDLNFIQRSRWRFITSGLCNTLLITLVAACILAVLVTPGPQKDGWRNKDNTTQYILTEVIVLSDIIKKQKDSIASA